MTSFLDRRPAAITNATGISYEVPLITVVTNLRRLMSSPVDRVGVISRAPLRSFVKRWPRWRAASKSASSSNR